MKPTHYSTVNRRQALGKFAIGALGLSFGGHITRAANSNNTQIPVHLKGRAKLFFENPRNAALEWFRESQFGLMIHYGLYSLDGVHSFHQWREKIPVAEYEKRTQNFRADKFDANFICDLAVEAGMKYVCLVTKHCDGFCLWDTKETDFNSVQSPAKRDLVAEVIAACNQRGLGFFAFYEHGFDWRHPHAPRQRDFPEAPKLIEVPYPNPEPTYAHGKDHDLNKYVDYVHAQITELLTNYGPIAGVWLDGAAVPASGDHTKFKLPELYDHIHQLQPHALISYKWGITGTEDFAAPEEPQTHLVPTTDKPVEMCWPLNKGWSWIKDAKRENADAVTEHLAATRKNGWNFLLNIGPVADGSVHPQDIITLKEVGRRLRK